MKLKTLIKKWSLLGLFPLSLTIQNSFAQEIQLDNTAAIVNDDIILESQLNDQTQSLLGKYREHGANVDEITARKQALQSLITRSLILQLARSSGYDMTDMELDSTLDQVALRNNTSVENILRSYGGASNLAQARENFKQEYILNEVKRSYVRQMIKVSDSEIDTLAKAIKERGGIEPMYHLAQIIIPFSAHPSDEDYFRIQAEARQAISKIKNGANIEEIAAKYATDDQVADLGYIPETAVPLPFLPAIVASAPGDVLGPFRSNVGMHIFKVFDITTNSVTPIKTYNASHILIKTSLIFSDEAARAKLMDIANQINSGTITFAQAAKQYSEDPGSAVKGGDLGYAPSQVYDPGFARGLESLHVGQMSQPIKSSFGWHLIKLNDIKIDRDSMQAFREKASEIIFEREFSQASKLWERNIRDMAYIHVIDPALLQAGVQIDNDAQDKKNQPFNKADDENSQQYSQDSRLIN